MSAQKIYARHDHDHCIVDALRRAERLCAQHGAKLTDLRRRVLEIVWGSHAPIGAYEILERLAKDPCAPTKAKSAPPTVYRALAFLQKLGVVHRIESRNAYVGCTRPDGEHDGQFLICRDCGQAAELDDAKLGETIRRDAASRGFIVESSVIELRGLCPECKGGNGQADAK